MATGSPNVVAVAGQLAAPSYLGETQLVTGGAVVSATNPVPVLGTSVRVDVTPTVTAQTYAVSKVIGGIMTFANVLPASLGGVLESITVKFKGSAQTVGFWVAIFDTSPTGTFTDTNTAAIASTDTAFLKAMYHLTVPSSMLGTHTIYNLDGIGKVIVGQTTSLYVVVVPDATTASITLLDMTVELGMLWG